MLQKTSDDILKSLDRTNAPPPKSDPRAYDVERLDATLTFNGVAVKLSEAEALLCWHLCVLGMLSPTNKNDVIPAHLKAGRDEEFLNRTATSLRNRPEFRNANKGDEGDPLSLFYLDGGDQGVKFNKGVKVTFRVNP